MCVRARVEETSLMAVQQYSTSINTHLHVGNGFYFSVVFRFFLIVVHQCLNTSPNLTKVEIHVLQDDSGEDEHMTST